MKIVNIFLYIYDGYTILVVRISNQALYKLKINKKKSSINK